MPSIGSVWAAVLMWGVICSSSALLGQTAAQAPAESPAQAPTQAPVVEVRIVGNRALPVAKILRHVHTRVGRPFDVELIGEDVRRLNHTGMFVTVKPFSQQIPGGRVVIFEVLERPILHEVLYVGNRSIKTKVLQKETNLKAGDAADPFAVANTRRKIEEFYRQKGFSNVRVTIKEGNKPGERRAVFVINEGRKQRILWTTFVGNTIASDSRLRTLIKSKPGFAWFIGGEVDRKQIDEDVNRLKMYYQGLGFCAARIGRELDFNAGGNWLALAFVIDEGPRFKVRNISIIGNKKFSTEKLTEKLKLTGDRYFNEAEMTHDINALKETYGRVGYIFADVKPELRYAEPQVDLVYSIEEGDRYRVGRIDVQIKGDTPHTRISTVLDRIPLKPGDIVDIRKLKQAEKLLRRSELFKVEPQTGSVPKIVFSKPEAEKLEDKTEIVRHPRHRANFRGQSPNGEGGEGKAEGRKPPTAYRLPPTAYRLPPTARRLPPATYRLPRTVRAQNAYDPNAGRSVPDLPPRLPQGGYSVRPAYRDPMPVAQPAPSTVASMPPPSLSPNEGLFSGNSPFLAGPGDEELTRPLPLRVLAEETQTGRLMFGVGINSDAGLMGSIVIDERNFDWTRFPTSWEDVRNATAWRGAGQRFRVEAVPGTEVQRYMISFQEPYLLHSEVGLGLSGFYYDRRYREWDEQQIGGRVSLGYQFTHTLSGSLAFRGAKININRPIEPTPAALAEVVGDNSLYGFRAQLTHDTRDNAFLATEGHLIEVAFEQVTGTYNYPRGDLDLRKYFLIHKDPDGMGRHVLSLSARMAISGSDTPIYEHYYAGGFSTIRGFDFRGASPLDPATGVLVGGEFRLLASAQYLFPITADDMLRAVVFCDTGTVEPTINDWNDKYRVAPGFGLRIMVPAMGPAPIALDFAFPISTEPGDREQIFSFFVGFNH